MVGFLVVEVAQAVREHLLVEVAAQQALLACHWQKDATRVSPWTRCPHSKVVCDPRVWLSLELQRPPGVLPATWGAQHLGAQERRW